MKTIIRLTRHKTTAEQAAELRRIYGAVEVVEMNESLPADPKGAVARFDELAEGADVVEVVLPVNLLEAILKFSAFAKRGGIIIRAAMQRTLVDGEAVFTFSHYERVVKVETVTERL